jgi:hypothetical protein
MTAKSIEDRLYFYITLEGWSKEDAQDYPGTYDWDYDEGPFFEDILEQVVLEKVKEKIESFGGLINSDSIASISIGADLIGMQGTLAQCMSTTQDDGSVSVSIIYGPDILEELLKAYWDKSYQVNRHLDLVIDHELVHLMDTKNLPSTNFDLDNTAPLYVFSKWLESWRSEGLADLIPFLVDERGLKTAEEVQNRIQFDLNEMLLGDWTDVTHVWDLKKIHKNLSYTPYEVGPWIIAKLIEEKSQKSLLGLQNFDLENRTLVNQILEIGLSISFKEFLKLLMQIKVGDKLILEKQTIVSLIRKLNQMSSSSEKNELFQFIDLHSEMGDEDQLGEWIIQLA